MRCSEPGSSRCRRERIDRGGRSAGRLGDRGDHRRGRAQADPRRGRSRCHRCARQQGNPGLRRRLVHAARGGFRCHRAAGRFRAQRPVSGDERARREDVRRVILTASEVRSEPRAPRQSDGNGRAGAQASQLVDGRESDDRFGHPDEQGARVDRGPSSVALAPAQIDVLVHPQSIVHSLVEFCDGSLIAQLGSPDMRIPIAYCLAWPERMTSPAPRLDLARAATLTFEADLARFPALALARRALEAGVPRPPSSTPRTRWRSPNSSLAGWFFGDSRSGRGRTRGRGVRNWTEPQSVEEALSAIIQDCWRADSCPKLPQRRRRGRGSDGGSGLGREDGRMNFDFLSGINALGGGVLGYLIPFLFSPSWCSSTSSGIS